MFLFSRRWELSSHSNEVENLETNLQIKTLSFDIVKVVVDTPNENSAVKRQWLTIELGDGQKGFIAKEYIRSPIDYRAIFEKKNGKWLMTAFIAGD